MGFIEEHFILLVNLFLTLTVTYFALIITLKLCENKYRWAAMALLFLEYRYYYRIYRSVDLNTLWICSEDEWINCTDDKKCKGYVIVRFSDGLSLSYRQRTIFATDEFQPLIQELIEKKRQYICRD